MKNLSGPIGSLDPSKETHIIGAGVSGLLIAYYLKQAGLNVTLFEKSNVGGKISTSKTNAGIAESAANAIFTNQDVMDLLNELELPYLNSREKLKRKLWRGDKARSFPLRPWEVLRVLPGLFKRPPQDCEKISVYDFFRPMLGNKVAYEVLSAVLGGIYATNSKNLHFKSVFKTDCHSKTYLGFFKQLAASRKGSGHRAQSISFTGGMGDFIRALEKKLEGNILKEEKISIDSSVNTIICSDAQDAAQLLRADFPEMAKELEQISYQKVSTGTYFFKRPASELESSFGILFPPGSGFNSIGILHNSAIFEGRSQTEATRSYTFISHQDFDEQSALDDLTRLNPNEVDHKDLLIAKQTTWKRGIPLYNLARYQASAKLRSLAQDKGPGLVLFGNYVDGISIREMVSAAKNFAGNFRAS